ncbi:hemerythrin domain-containing protein [Brevundimonas vancanneytii]|uniref:Uncharacterized conserved protein n=1 Tax=Brevundimonas vancanneytii TaxID=1325724 RepID=A0A4P1K1M0_9CAUL|nr:hemerythrin domain-containing protein [Brevundimonas vancanneytii]VTO14297.1 Uncharacterized conserved protein [Brevundimonas vancanneytii]
MTPKASSPGMTQGVPIEPMPMELIASPLDWLFAEHYRQRQLCRTIDAAAVMPERPSRLLAVIIDYLRHDLPLHVLDEEEDLFPLLRRRCPPEDDIHGVLGMLSSDHHAEAASAARLADRLEEVLRASGDRPMTPDLVRSMGNFTQRERRHIALENAVVLPIARLRLTPRDLSGLSRRLAARRGRG